MQGSLRKLLIYNLVVLLVAVQLVIVINYWYFVFKNITHASIRDTISYQGKIVDVNSVAIPDASYKMRFSIYDHATDTDPEDKLLWTETWDGSDQDALSPGSQNSLVSVSGGIFSVELNSLCGSWSAGCASNGGVDFSSSSLYLLVELDKNGNNAYEERFLPRKRFSSTAYSMNSAKFDGKILGTSGNTVPLLDGANTWSGVNSFSQNLITSSLSSGAVTFDMTSGASTAVSTPTVPSIANPNIVSYWKFDEGTGATSADAVGGRTLNMTNATWLTGGAFGYTGDNGISLNGSTQNITVTDDAGLNPSSITVYAWVKTTDAGALRGLVDKGWQSGGYILQLRNGIPSFDTQDGSNNFYISTGTTNVANNAWHMIAGTFNSITQELKIYVDGVLENTTTSVSMAATPALDLVIGGDNISSNRLSGLLDNIVIYNSANTAVDILADYNAGIGSPTGNKLAYNFDTSTSLASTDKLASWKSSGTEKSFLNGDGGLYINSVLDSSNNKELAFNSSASAVNYLTMTNGATTASPIISADGETDLSLYIKPKGTGSIVISSQSASAVPLIVTGADLQTGNLQEWRNNSGAALVSVSSVGLLTLTTVDPEIRLVNSGNSEYTRFTRSATDNKMSLFNRVSVPGVAPLAVSPHELSFNRLSSQYVDLTNDAALKPTAAISVETWYKSTDGNYSFLVSAGNPNATGYGYSLTYSYGVGLNFQIGQSGAHRDVNYGFPDNYPPGQPNISDGNWHHVVGTYDGTNQILYFDGVSVGTPLTWSGAIGYDAYPVAIGATNFTGSASNFFNGTIDEVKIYNTALTPTQVAVSYNSGVGKYGSAEAGLVGGYHFDEGTGSTTADFSGNSLTGGALVNGPTWQTGERAPAPPSELSFNGSSQYIALSNDVALRPTAALTIEAWANTNDATAVQSIVVQNMNPWADFKGFAFFTYLNKAYLRLSNGSVYADAVSADASIQNNTWYHLVGTWDGINIKLYVNGALVSTTAMSGTITYDPHPLYIGAGPISYSGEVPTFQSTAFYNGIIDEVKIYNNALNDTQVTADYNSGNGLYGTATSGLVAAYHLDEGSGTLANDYSGNHLNGTLVGAPTWMTGIKAIAVITGPSASNSEVTILQSQDGVAEGEAGILTVGADAGTTKIIGSNVWLGTGALLSVSGAGILTSGVPNGTAPFVVTSTTEVHNLNANLLQGHPASDFALSGGGGGGGTPDGNSWKLIYDYTVPDTPGPVDSVTADESSTIGSVALDGDADGVYQIVMSVIHVQNGASINIQPNGDNGFHYFFQYTLSDGGTVSSGRGSSYDSLPGPYVTTAPSSSMYTGFLYAKRNGQARLSKAEIVRDGSSSSINMQNVVAGWVSTDNITSIKFQSNVLNAIGVGSRFMIWKKN